MTVLHAASTIQRFGEGWVFSPGIVVPLVIMGGMYAWGAAVLSERVSAQSASRSVRGRQSVCFALGWLTIAAALLSPLHELSEKLFWVHMMQHELLMVVAAPLIVLTRPIAPMLWALPSRGRLAVGAMTRQGWWKATWHFLSRPSTAWLLQALAIWLWHVPSVFESTIDSEAIHAAQHLSFLLTALLFWWSVLHGVRRQSTSGAGVMYLFTTFMYTGALGALLTFSRVPWYPRYAGASTALGFTPVEDQQLAGLIMWLPGSTSYLLGALALLARWMNASETRVSLRERSAT